MLPWLKAGERSVSAWALIASAANVLAGAQLALCVVLLTGAGLASRSLYLIGTADLHFAKDHLLLASLNTSGAAQGERQNIALLERLFAEKVAAHSRRDRSVVRELRASI